MFNKERLVRQLRGLADHKTARALLNLGPSEPENEIFLTLMGEEYFSLARQLRPVGHGLENDTPIKTLAKWETETSPVEWLNAVKDLSRQDQERIRRALLPVYRHGIDTVGGLRERFESFSDVLVIPQIGARGATFLIYIFSKEDPVSGL